MAQASQPHATSHSRLAAAIDRPQQALSHRAVSRRRRSALHCPIQRRSTGGSCRIIASCGPPSCTVTPTTAKPQGKPMSDEVELPSLIVKTAKSEFRLRCHAAAWSKAFGGSVQVSSPALARIIRACCCSVPPAPTPPPKPLRATLYQPDIQAGFSLKAATTEQMIKARTDFRRQARHLRCRGRQAGPRSDSSGRHRQDSRPHAQHERRPSLVRAIRAKLHDALAATLDSVAESRP